MSLPKTRAARRRQHRINHLVKVVFGLLGAIAVIGLVFAGFYKLAIKKFVPSEAAYLRDVYILIDQTRSMNESQLQEVKSVVREQILDRLGLGDKVFCYRIGSDFDEIRDRVFAGEQDRLKVPGNLMEAPIDTLPEDLKADLLERWQLFETERKRWGERLAELAPAEGQYSDYLGTLRNIGRRIKNDPSVAAKQWLIIAGDLEHDTADTQIADYPASKDEKWQYSGVDVHLVYPGGAHDEAEQKKIEQDWHKYFGSRGNKHIKIVSFDQFIGDFPPSSVPRPEKLRATQD